MLDIVRQAQAEFMAIESILNTDNINRDQKFFTILSEMTDKAYLTMNNGMCESSTVCQHCAEHRDYLLSTLSMLDELSAGQEFTQSYQEQMDIFTNKITDILEKISSTIGSAQD